MRRGIGPHRRREVDPRRLLGASVAVTGGGRGIGRAATLHLARRGARVAVGDLDEGAARAVTDEVRAAGGQALGLRLDVADGDDFRAFLDAAEQAHGALDVLVNNAGIDWMGPFHVEPDAVTRRQVEVNLLGTTTGTRLALQRMLPRAMGHVVNVSSGVGRLPLPGSASYCATKHAIVGLTESLRMEYRGSGVGFSLIQPAQVETAMMDGQPRHRRMPVVSADDVAAAIVDAVLRDRFEVWVPRNQAVGAKVQALLPRTVREALLRAAGLGNIAGKADMEHRRGYHERMFDQS